MAVGWLSTTEWLAGAKFAYAFLTVLVATLASAAVVTVRFAKRKRAANATSAPTTEPTAATSDADPLGATSGQLLTPSVDSAMPASKVSPPPSLARSCLVATSRPQPHYTRGTTTQSSTPGPRKQPAKSCWKYSFSRSFCSVVAAATLPPSEGKENVALLPSKHGVTSRLFERMCKRRKKEGSNGSPPHTPPALAGNKHNLAALPASQQSPKKPKMMPPSAPSFGSPITEVLRALPCDPNTPHPVRTAPGSPAPARLHFNAPPVLSSSAPTLSYMPTFTPGSPPSNLSTFPFPPPLAALSSLPNTAAFAPASLPTNPTFTAATLPNSSPFTPASLPPRPPSTNPFPLPTLSSLPTAFASPFTPASPPPSHTPPLPPSPSPPQTLLHFSPPPQVLTSSHPPSPPPLPHRSPSSLTPTPDPAVPFPHAVSLPTLTIPPTLSTPSPPHPSPTSTPPVTPPPTHPDPLFTQLMALMPTFQALPTAPPLPPTPTPTSPPPPADGNTRAGSKRRTERQAGPEEAGAAPEGLDAEEAAEQPLKRKGGRVH